MGSDSSQHKVSGDGPVWVKGLSVYRTGASEIRPRTGRVWDGHRVAIWQSKVAAPHRSRTVFRVEALASTPLTAPLPSTNSWPHTPTPTPTPTHPHTHTPTHPHTHKPINPHTHTPILCIGLGALWCYIDLRWRRRLSSSASV